MQKQILFAGYALIFMIFGGVSKNLDAHNFKFFGCFGEFLILLLCNLLKSVLNYFYILLFFKWLFCQIILMDYPIDRNDTGGFFRIQLVVLLCLQHVANAIRRQEIDSLPDVVGLRKPTVIRLEEGANIVPWLLVNFVDRNTSVHDFERVYHESYAI